MLRYSDDIYTGKDYKVMPKPPFVIILGKNMLSMLLVALNWFKSSFLFLMLIWRIEDGIVYFCAS